MSTTKSHSTKTETVSHKEKTMKKIVATSTPVISQADIDTCIAHVQAIAAVMKPYAVSLTAAQRRAQSRYRKEGDSVIPVLSRLAKAAGVSGSGMDADTMQAQADLAAALQPLHTQVKTLTDSIGDTVLAAHGNAWYSATTLHGALRRMSKSDNSLRRDMEAVASAFTHRSAKKAASPSTPATASTEPAASPAKVQPATTPSPVTAAPAATTQA
jgi:hypothetical protein